MGIRLLQVNYYRSSCSGIIFPVCDVWWYLCTLYVGCRRFACKYPISFVCNWLRLPGNKITLHAVITHLLLYWFLSLLFQMCLSLSQSGPEGNIFHQCQQTEKQGGLQTETQTRNINVDTCSANTTASYTSQTLEADGDRWRKRKKCVALHINFSFSAICAILTEGGCICTWENICLYRANMFCWFS